jgi:hypothetical protein
MLPIFFLIFSFLKFSNDSLFFGKLFHDKNIANCDREVNIKTGYGQHEKKINSLLAAYTKAGGNLA